MEVKAWTYEEFPAFAEPVAGAHRVVTTGGEVAAEYVPSVPYAQVDGATLHLQVLVPKRRRGFEKLLPCVVYVQGSAWRVQNRYRDVPQLGRLASRGYVVVMVEYRPSSMAAFPAQIQDAQNAVRFMRAHAAEYGVDPARVVLAGNSSGGHTAVFAGFYEAGGNQYPGVSAAVRGIIDLYGAVSLMRADGFPSTVDHHLPTSPEGMLMGGIDLRERPDLCREASAECHITPELELPPVLIAHGTKDRTVSAQLSVDLYEKLRACGKDAELYLLEGADHGGPEFFAPQMINIYDAFVQRCTA